jgi:steroid delta-isomerase-like uncharacterized protein
MSGMSIEANKTALRRAIASLSPGTLDTYLQLYHPDAKLHFLPPGLPPGIEGARIFYQRFLSAFPDARLAIEDFVAEGESVAARYTLEATHFGEFMGVPPTGRRISLSGITILHFADGKCVERWSEQDLLGLLQQIGGMPGPQL